MYTYISGCYPEYMYKQPRFVSGMSPSVYNYSGVQPGTFTRMSSTISRCIQRQVRSGMEPGRFTTMGPDVHSTRKLVKDLAPQPAEKYPVSPPWPP